MAITDFGSRIERFPEILNEIEELQRQLIDPAINNRDDEFLSENNMIVSEQLARCKEFLEAIKDNWDVSKVEGFALDNLLQLKKVYRIGESRSYTYSQRFLGQVGAMVPSGTVLLSSTTNDMFTTEFPLILTPESAIQSVFTIVSAEDNTEYSLVVNGRVFTYTTSSSATTNEIYQAFLDLFSAAYIPNVVLTSSSENEEIIISSTTGSFVNVIYSSNLSVKQVTSSVLTRAREFGNIIAPIGTVNRLQRPIVGISSTFNEQAYIPGRLTETDEEFRRRGTTSVSSDGTATTPAIIAGIYNNVPGVSSVFLIENDSHLFDENGRPPHSYEVVVSGGDDQDIGEEMWRTKPSSIPTYGNTEVVVRDSNNNLRSIYFTRPLPITFAVRVLYTIYDEELFPVNGIALIRSAVVNHINSLGIGKDVIPGRVEAAIYNGLPNQGLDEVSVEIQIIPSPGSTPNPSNWTTDRVPVSDVNYASTSQPDLYIEEI